MTMVAKCSRYFGSPFKVQHGMTQGYPLYPTVFTFVVDAVLRHQVTVVTAEDGKMAPDKGGFGQYIQLMTEYLYSDNILLESTLKHVYTRSLPS